MSSHPRPADRSRSDSGGARARPVWQLNVAAIVDRPGTSRPLAVDLPVPPDLELPLATVVADVHVQGVVESVVDGILVRGSLRAPVQLSCARCLADINATLDADVVELFRDPAEGEPGDEVEPGYELIEGHLDLQTLLRDALVPAVPPRPLCRPDCAGLCPRCGADRNLDPCDCDAAPADPRWSALQELRLPES